VSIHHQTIITCDQNPLPDRCRNNLVIDLGQTLVSPGGEAVVIAELCARQDWGIIDVPSGKAHYCPYHRPVR
jgi:hypothetical protein